MSAYQSRSANLFQRIAEALNTDISDFLKDYDKSQRLDQTMEMMDAFRCVVRPEDRRACIDFAQSFSSRRLAEN